MSVHRDINIDVEKVVNTSIPSFWENNRKIKLII